MVLQGEALQGKSDGAVVGDDDDDVGEEDDDYDSDDDLGETSKELQSLARNSTEVPLWAVSILSVSRTLWTLPTGSWDVSNRPYNLLH